MLIRKCKRCDGVMGEEQITLASERRAVLAYHCVHCGRTEYGAVISAHKKALSERNPDGRSITGDRLQSHV